MDRLELSEIIAQHAERKGALLPMLHDIQHAFGCVDAFAEAEVASVLNLSRAEVHGVVSFYHDFTAARDPRHVVELCRAEACKARGVEARMPAAEAAAGERVRLKTVYCLGLCATGPNARTGDTLHARRDEASLTQANVVTTEFSDWATNCPEYKVTAVQVMASNGPTDWQEDYASWSEKSRRIVVAGAE